jgi:predicted GNAT family acetyltransferase
MTFLNKLKKYMNLLIMTKLPRQIYSMVYYKLDNNTVKIPKVYISRDLKLCKPKTVVKLER